MAHLDGPKMGLVNMSLQNFILRLSSGTFVGRPQLSSRGPYGPLPHVLGFKGLKKLKTKRTKTNSSCPRLFASRPLFFWNSERERQKRKRKGGGKRRESLHRPASRPQSSHCPAYRQQRYSLLLVGCFFFFFNLQGRSSSCPNIFSTEIRERIIKRRREFSLLAC